MCSVCDAAAMPSVLCGLTETLSAAPPGGAQAVPGGHHPCHGNGLTAPEAGPLRVQSQAAGGLPEPTAAALPGPGGLQGVH